MRHLTLAREGDNHVTLAASSSSGTATATVPAAAVRPAAWPPADMPPAFAGLHPTTQYVAWVWAGRSWARVAREGDSLVVHNHEVNR